MTEPGYPAARQKQDMDWQRHCGFLDLSTEQFMAIQETLLLQQIERVAGSGIGRKLIGTRVPKNLDDFRRWVPLSSYQDYLPEFSAGNEDALPEPPWVWGQTSAASGTFRRVPYTREFYEQAIDNLMTAFILACSDGRGSSRIAEGDKVLYNVAPAPYISGILADGATEMFNLRPVLHPDEQAGLDFKDKVATGFEVSLKTGVDILVAMTSVLVKMGNDFNRLSSRRTKSRRIPHPAVLLRMAEAFLRSKMAGRRMLPRDLWPVKAVIGWGIDTPIYRELVRRYWGVYPYELHACTEAGIMALQSWTRKGLTLLPHSNFFEFIPENEWLLSRGDIFYQPRTVLLDELTPGERYEVVITSFYGMPFLRYRLGHLIGVTALEDAEAGIRLPQVVFEARADDLIDIAGFTRISEKTIAQAIANAGIEHEEWTIRKEARGDGVALHVYIEMNRPSSDPVDDIRAVDRLHRELVAIDPGYRDLEGMMEIRPLEMTVLGPGTFAEYYARKRDAGVELLQCKPPRMDPADEIIEELLRIGDGLEVSRPPVAAGGGSAGAIGNGETRGDQL